jgi:hypothetical protein
MPFIFLVCLTKNVYAAKNIFMINRYNDSSTSYVTKRLATATPEQIESFIYEVCELDSASYMKNTINILGTLKFKTIVESKVEILKKCLSEKAYKVFEVMFLDTDLDKQIISTLFLNKAPPLEIAVLLNNLTFKEKFFKAVDRNQIEELKVLIQSDDFEKYPNLFSLMDKSLMRMFTSFSQDTEMLDYFVSEEKLKDLKDFILKQSLNLAVFTHKYDILKHLIMDLNMERTKYVDILLELDRDKVATSLFNARDLQRALETKLTKKSSDIKEEIIKI